MIALKTCFREIFAKYNPITDMSCKYMPEIDGYADNIDAPRKYNLELGNAISGLCDGIFEGLYNLSAVALPLYISSVPAYAFKNCYNLISIELPAAILSIGDYAFENCSSLQSVIICAQANVAFGNDIFKNCASLSTIILTPTNLNLLECSYGI